MRRVIPAFILSITYSFCAFSQEFQMSQSGPLHFEAAYIGDNLNVLKGGIKTGSCYLGMVNLKVNLQTEKAGLWKGGELFINIVNTHGASPSRKFVGDYQVTSNIEAGEHTYIQELWYRHIIGPVSITAGLQDLNIKFTNTENGILYLNSSFGIPPTLTGNVPVSVFPLTSPGITINWTINEKLTWINALYDGSPTDFDKNHYNLKWKLSKFDGVFVISEFQKSYMAFEKPGKLKAGFYSHHHLINETGNPEGHDTTYIHKIGIYLLADQKLWQHAVKNKYLAAFVQFGLSPYDYHHNHYYLGLGLNYYGLFNRKGNDALGVAMAHAGLHRNTHDETSLELTYMLKLTQHIFLQPDIQYIINPAGLQEHLDNCLVASVRFGISFT